jgi:zinc protease
MAEHPVLHRHQIGAATVLTLPEPSLPIVRFALVSRRGSLADPAGKAGRARVMMELLLRGTQSKSREVWNQELERLGSQIFAQVANELVLFHGVALKKNLAPTLELLAEALLTPALDDAEREGFVDELVDSLRYERDSDEALVDIFWRRVLHPGHPLRHRPTGEPAELLTLNADDMGAAYRAHWRDGELIAAMAGDVTEAEAREAVAPLLTSLGTGAGPLFTLPALPEPVGLDVLVVDKPERTQVQLCVGRCAASGFAPDAHAFWLGTVAFGGTFTSKLTREVRDVRGWSYTAHVEYARKRPFPSSMAIRSAPAAADAVACLALELDLYRELAKGELEAGAVDFARSYLLNRYPLEMATPTDLLLPAVRNELLGLEPDELFSMQDRLRALSADEVSAALRRHLHPTQVAVVLVATATAIVPELRARFPEAKIAVVPYCDGLPEGD